MAEGGFCLVQCERGTGWQNRKTEKSRRRSKHNLWRSEERARAKMATEERRNKGAVLSRKLVDDGPFCLTQWHCTSDMRPWRDRRKDES